MNDTMYHRGPNDSGVEIYPFRDGYNVGFAQRRLSIMDLSPLGHQPMHSDNRRVSVIFNGEIYNFQELKQELSDYPFKSNCDTEVIIAAYLRWGIRCVERLHGMFAIAIFDRESDDVYLIRDRIGKKPLYYWQNGTNLVFGSELKPFMKCPGFKGIIRKDVLSRYLYQQYINAPDSIFEDVYKLEPGCILQFHLGDIKITKYWDVHRVYDRESAHQVQSYEEARAELKKRLQKAVADRMIADVPLGIFLSGGYDSSLITAMAQEHSEMPVKTFSIGFEDKRYNEADYARAIARHLGTDHTEMIISEKQMFDLVDSIPHYFDEPFADDSEIPTMLVSEVARKKVTVALSGDGGDEFFCGYNYYEKLAQAQKLELPGLLAYYAGQLPIGKGHLIDRYPRAMRLIAENRDPATKVQIASDLYIDAAEKFVPGGQLPCKYPVEEAYPISNWQVRRMLLDMDTYLPGDILCKVDRASMKYSLEARSPIMDTAVMEYSYRIPHRFKYCHGDKKHILKDIAWDYIPKELLERPKTGFSVPIDKWLRGPLRERLIDYSSTEYLRRQNIFDPEYAARFISDYLVRGDEGPGTGGNLSGVAWSFFVFQQWYEYEQYKK
ncbi:MAG: asparagine synthase (glutamine-hydrolyzing) [Butyrivibrio sp.]|jgi:asparagine synthase (glutamine-hydrolysing)|nr:asparagine synthase (glutamine-hydrolyzing) [Butyrivibrio sp.]